MMKELVKENEKTGLKKVFAKRSFKSEGISFFKYLLVLTIGMFLYSCDKDKEDEPKPVTPEYELKSTDFIVEQDKEGWDEVVTFAGGQHYFYNYHEETERVEQFFAIVKGDKEYVPVYGVFDEKEVPIMFGYDNLKFHVTRWDEESADFMMYKNDSLYCIATDIPHKFKITDMESKSRGFRENNAVRNIVAGLLMVAGTSEILSGVSTVAASGAITLLSSGTLTPAAAIGAIAGAVTITSGWMDFQKGLELLAGGTPAPPTFNDMLKAQSLAFLGLTMEGADPKSSLNEWLKDNTGAKFNWKTLSTGTKGGFFSLFLNGIDMLYGKTIDKDQQIHLFYQKLHISSGILPVEVGSTTALLKGLFSIPTVEGMENLEYETGIICYEKENKSNRSSSNNPVSEDGTFKIYSIDNLKPDTEYCYFAYFRDLTNLLHRFQEIHMPFRTKAEDNELKQALIDLYQSTNGDNWTRKDNWCSDKPVEEWYGISCENGKYSINLGNNNLTGKISGIKFPESVVSLNCFYNQLTALDVSGSASLKKLICSCNKLTTINVSGCTSLENLDCGNNDNTLTNRLNQLTALDVSDCTALKILDCGYNQLTALDVSNCTSLTSLDCGRNQLTALDVSKCTALKSLNCGLNQLTTLDVSKCTSLENLNFTSNQLTTLDVSMCTSLTSLDCGGSQLTTLDVSMCTSLTSLNCRSNQLTTLDVSMCTSLTSLGCGGNQLTTLDVSKCTSLEYLDCGGNQLTMLDASNLTALKALNFFDAVQLASLNVSGCTSLQILTCVGGESTTQLTNLNVSGCTSLKELYCSKKQLATLDISTCTSLENLICRSNQLTTLDVSKCTSLEYLDCRSNQLTTLDVSKCTSLEYLDCEYNKISMEIPSWFSQLEHFSYDIRYRYYEVYDEVIEVCVTKYEDKGYGWWYPGEPGKGKHEP